MTDFTCKATINTHTHTHAEMNMLNDTLSQRAKPNDDPSKLNERPLDQQQRHQKKWRCKNYSQYSEQAVVVVSTFSSNNAVSFINY